MVDHDKLDFTGERFVPTKTGDIALEHLHRYTLAREIVTGKAVLDIACGEGYGSFILASRATSVTGVDIAEEAISHAQARYEASNLSYKLGSCEAIPLDDQSVDIVVSFETIEHHDKHHEMMREIKRVLKADGVLVISSPDKHIYSEIPRRVNPFHVKELYENEFKEIISQYYVNSNYFGQSIVYGSSILSETATDSLISLQYDDGVIRKTPKMVGPVYWIAVASDQQLPNFPESFLRVAVDQSDMALNLHNEIAEREWRIQKLDEQILAFKQVLKQRDRDIATLNEQIRGFAPGTSLYRRFKRLLSHKKKGNGDGERDAK